MRIRRASIRQAGIRRAIKLWLLTLVFLSLTSTISATELNPSLEILRYGNADQNDESLVPNLPAGAGLNLELERFVQPNQLSMPVDVTHAGDSRLFVVERQGRIRIVRADGSVEPVPFLDINERVLSDASERGLLGLAFHPDYRQNGVFYVNYTAEPDGDTRVSRFSVTAGNADVADPNSELLLLEINQPYPNHNAGDLLFGPQDGYLYIPLGDGGSGNDPQNRAQNMELLLGKLLRIDVDQGPGNVPDCGAPGNYTIPVDNPFLDGEGGACDEIWALGLRNPWRASFDRQTHNLYIGDVGQGQWEEIDMQPADATGGENYGWPCYEGTHYNNQNNMPVCEDPGAYEMPIFEINQDQNGACAVTGGYVYRGLRFPQMQGHYFLTDLCAAYLWDLQNVGGAWQNVRHDNMQSDLGGVVSFGEDVYGELFLAHYGDDVIYRLVEDTLVTTVDPDLLLPLVSK